MQHPDPDQWYPSVQQPPLAPPKQSFWRRKVGCMPLWLILGFIGLFCLISVTNFITTGGKGIGNTGPTPTPLASATPTPTDTPTPTQTPTAKPTTKPTTESSLAPTYGRPQLGGLISDFVGKYGRPNYHTDTNTYNWFPDSANGPDGLIVNRYVTSKAFTGQTDWITVNAINGQVWSTSEATELCTAYNPLDAHKITVHIPVVNGLGELSGFDVVYWSASLAKEFAQSDFIDDKGNDVPMGTFDILYTYQSNGSITSCSILVGKQQTNG